MADQDEQQEREALTMFSRWLSLQEIRKRGRIFQILDTALEYRQQLDRARTLDIFNGIEDLHVSDPETVMAILAYFADTSLYRTPGKLAIELRTLEYFRVQGIAPMPILPLRKLPTLDELLRNYGQQHQDAVDEIPKNHRDWQILKGHLCHAILDHTDALEQDEPGSELIQKLRDMDVAKIEQLSWNILTSLKNVHTGNNNPSDVDEQYDSLEDRFQAVMKALRVSKLLAGGLTIHPDAVMRLVAAPKHVLVRFVKAHERHSHQKAEARMNAQQKAAQVEVTQAAHNGNYAGGSNGTLKVRDAEQQPKKKGQEYIPVIDLTVQDAPAPSQNRRRVGNSTAAGGDAGGGNGKPIKEGGERTAASQAGFVPFNGQLTEAKQAAEVADNALGARPAGDGTSLKRRPLNSFSPTLDWGQRWS